MQQHAAPSSEPTTASDNVARIFALHEAFSRQLAEAGGYAYLPSSEPDDHAAALCAAISALLTRITRGDYDHISPEACPAVAAAREAQRAYWHDQARAAVEAAP